MPTESDRGLLHRVGDELNHWFRSEWSFEDVGRHWDETQDYDDINRRTYSYSRRFSDALRLSELEPKSCVLDFCARTGNGTAYFYEHGKVGYAVCADVSMGMGEICMQRLQSIGFKNFSWIQIVDYQFPFSDHSFDAVLCFETVEHFSQPERLVLELGRVTRPGGTIILTSPNVIWEPVHALAAITKLHHSEGPHRFIRYRRLKRMIQAASFDIKRAETTVLVPGGPNSLVKLGEWIEAQTQSWLMPVIGLRRVVIGKKR